MGTYTKFSLRVSPARMDKPVREALTEASGYGCAVFIEDVEEGHTYINGGDGPKWYESHKHALAVSKRFPSARFWIAQNVEGGDAVFVTKYERGVHESVVSLPSVDPRDLFGLVDQGGLSLTLEDLELFSGMLDDLPAEWRDGMVAWLDNFTGVESARVRQLLEVRDR